MLFRKYSSGLNLNFAREEDSFLNHKINSVAVYFVCSYSYDYSFHSVLFLYQFLYLFLY